MSVSFRRSVTIGRWISVSGALALAAFVGDQPWQPIAPIGLVRIDALSALFILLTLLELAVMPSDDAQPWQTTLAALPLLIAYLTANTLVICLGYLVFTWLTLFRLSKTPFAWIMHWLPAIMLNIGLVSTIVTSGLWRYDLSDAVGTLGSMSFAFVLVAALLGSQPLFRAALPRWLAEGMSSLRRRSTGSIGAQSALSPIEDMWALPWLYPLLRLYSWGPWNAGWSFGALLLGCAVALWCASLASAATPTTPRTSALRGALLGLALACAALGSAAGLAACGVALLCAIVLAVGLEDAPPLPLWLETASLWMLAGALPITLPFVVAWLAIGAAAAGGVLLAAAAFWLVGLANALAVLRVLHARRSAQPSATENQTVRPLLSRRSLAAFASLLLGITAPVLLQWPMLPVARQLQGGLSPYGDLVVWPWIGLAAVDSGRQQVAILPSVAVAGLMLVLCALAWLLSRLLPGSSNE